MFYVKGTYQKSIRPTLCNTFTAINVTHYELWRYEYSEEFNWILITCTFYWLSIYNSLSTF